MGMGPLWIMNIAISVLIVAALLYSLRAYLITRRIARTKFTNALVALTGIFLLQNIYAAYMFYRMAWESPSDIAPPLLILNLIGFAGFTVFFYLSRT
jgi:integral membrane sensor domain MASE1